MPGAAFDDHAAPAPVSRPRVYLDHHATTPLDPRVLAAMLPYFTEHFGNPASQDHGWGWEAAEAVDAGRAAVARCIGATPEEIVFTSGATESTNLALLGAACAHPDKRHLVTSAVEHVSVLRTAEHLRSRGYRLTILPVDADGLVDPDAVRAALAPDTLLVSLQAANNEVGTLQALPAIGAACQRAGVLFHVDAAQAVGWLPVDVDSARIDLLSLSAHKVYGPKGVGALYVRRRIARARIDAIAFGGGQEAGLRPGTANVPGIVGFAEACRLAVSERGVDAQRVTELRDDLLRRIRDAEPEVVVNGHPTHRLANNLHITIPGCDAEHLLRAMAGIAFSTGAACSSHRHDPSHVLLAMGRSASEAYASVRFGLGRFTTAAEIAHTGDRLADVLARTRSCA